MLSVEEALERVLSYFHPLDQEEKPLLQALGQTLARDIVSPLDIPPLDNSAMDGYAVRWEDIEAASEGSPVELEVIGQVAAGQLPRRRVRKGTAVRIMTGAPIPSGADTVVPFEDTDEVPRKARLGSINQIGILRVAHKGANVRPAAEDIRRGQVVLQKGTVLGAAHIGVLASLGFASVPVIRRPVVAILATGNELVRPGRVSRAGKIYDSNSFSVAAAVQRCGGIPHLLGIAKDNLPDMFRKIEKGLSADLLVTSAGVSKGDYDVVKDVLVQRGEISFWSVRMRPAKPLAFGAINGPHGRSVPHIGLPGNPVSALVAFEVFCRPAILKMLGRARLERPSIEAVLESSIRNTDGRRVYARVAVSRRGSTYYARLTGPQGSHILTSMALADGLAVCPEDVFSLEPGQRAKVLMFEWPEEMPQHLS
ncbi:MAG: molybdopterin molybdotransferase MoeA [Chloroflexi bacterium]|nr:molybdopterin molybdotransferase MoeA [Chloroflexota bacterium]